MKHIIQFNTCRCLGLNFFESRKSILIISTCCLLFIWKYDRDDDQMKHEWAQNLLGHSHNLATTGQQKEHGIKPCLMFRIGQRIEYIYTEAMETRFLFPCRNHGSFIQKYDDWLLSFYHLSQERNYKKNINFEKNFRS